MAIKGPESQMGRAANDPLNPEDFAMVTAATTRTDGGLKPLQRPDGLETIVYEHEDDQISPVDARRQAPSRRDAVDFEARRAADGSIGRRAAAAAEMAVATPPSGASALGSEPIGGSPRRVDCDLMDQLNVIIGFAGLLVESHRLDARHRRYASHIAASGARTCAILRAFFQAHRAGSRTGPRGTGRRTPSC